MVEACFQSETLADDGDEHVDGHGDPDLGLHRVLALAVKCLDPQILLERLEQLNDILPINSALLK